MKERSVVPSFATVEEARRALEKRNMFEPADLYPRDGTLSLAELEAQYADFVGVDNSNLLVVNSGMSAIVEAAEIAYPTKGDTIACAFSVYSQSLNYFFTELAARGIKVIGFDSGSIKDIKIIIEEHKPKIIFAETVANAVDMPVLPLEQFLELPQLNETEPLIILDNTLPTASVLPLATLAQSSGRKVLVVESGTKAFARNTDLLGLIYTNDTELITKIRQRRRITGSILSYSATRVVAESSLKSKEDFDARNRKVISNSLTLAKAAEKARRPDSPFMVNHPNLQSHANFAYCQEKFPQGATPVFFLACTNSLDQFQLAECLWENPQITQYCELGQSFGLEKTRIWPYQGYPTVRISAGNEDPEDIKVLASEFYKVLASL